MKYQYIVNFLCLVGFVSIVAANRNNVCKKWISYAVRDISKNCYYDVDAKSDVPSIITRHGYKFEGLKAKTKDGYFLSIFRIPGKGVPVLLVHTYLLSSASFVSQIDKKDALAFLLADKGYDVYLLNFRGTRYSQQHEIYTTEDHKFWDTGIDEIARYDLEAAFTLIERVSGQKKLLYIGHQVGATALLAYGSINPDKIKEKVAGAALISPFVEMRNSGSLVSRFIGRHPDFIWKYKETIGLDKLLSSYKYQKPVVTFISSSGFLMFLFAVDKQIRYGREKELTAQSTPYFLNSDKEGGSYKIYLGINQYTARPFAAFDYGKNENQKRYGTKDPPLYNYTAIEVPLFIVHASNQKFPKKKDVDLLYSKLAKEAKSLGRLEIKEKHTTDYALVFGQNAKSLVYKPLLEKFETLKEKIQEETKSSGGSVVKEEQQQTVSGGDEEENNPFWQVFKQQVEDKKDKKEEVKGPKSKNESIENDEKIQNNEEGLIESSNLGEAKQEAEKIEAAQTTENAGNYSVKEAETGP